MLFKGDCSLGFVVNGGPSLLGHDGPGKPIHVEGEVVQLAQMHVRRDCPPFENCKEVLGLRLYERAVAEAVERVVVGGGLPAVLGGAGFEADNLIHDVLPGALADHGIGVLEVDACQAQIHSRLAAGVIERIPQALAGGLMMGLGASIAGGDSILHGLSGVPVLAVSSFVFIVTAFLGSWLGIRLGWLD